MACLNTQCCAALVLWFQFIKYICLIFKTIFLLNLSQINLHSLVTLQNHVVAVEKLPGSFFDLSPDPHLAPASTSSGRIK